MIAFRISDKSASVLLNGRMRTLHMNHPNFSAVVVHLNNGGRDEDFLASLIDIPAFIAKETHGLVTVSDNAVRYNGEAIHNHLATRIINHLKDGISIQPLCMFLDRLMLNPNEEIRNDVFEWLEAGDMPITEDGFLIGFKTVGVDYYSQHSGKDGKVLHAIGTVVSMDRDDCDENRNATCSSGLHFCSYGYLGSYAGGDSHILIMKVSPENITAIPKEYSLQKGRCCSYEVIGEIEHSEAEDFFRGKRVTSPSADFEHVEDYDNDGSDCPDCGDYGCTCDDCIECGEHMDSCTCDDDDEINFLEESDDVEGDNPSLKGHTLFDLRESVDRYGQRGTCRLLGIPRSSLYDFLKLHEDK